MAEKGKTYTTKPTTQLDLERRLAEEKGEEDDEGRSFAVEGNDLDGYVGVDPEYMTYASDISKPLAADGGPEAEVEKRLAEEGWGLEGETSEPAPAPKAAPAPEKPKAAATKE